MRKRNVNRILICVFAALVLVQASKADELGNTEPSMIYGIYGGYEYMYRSLKLQNSAAGTLAGPRVGLSLAYPLSQSFKGKVSVSSGFSKGKNASKTATFQEEFTSWDIEPTVSLQYKLFSVGLAVRYESFKVDTLINSQYISNIYRGYEVGPSVQMVILNLKDTFDITLGIEYLTGTLSSLESNQVGAKLQMGLSF